MNKTFRVAAVLLDLEEFTSFSNQTSLLNLVKFSESFHNWLLISLRYLSRNKKPNESDFLSDPQFVKSTGDGVLLLWNLNEMAAKEFPVFMQNLVLLLQDLLVLYNNPKQFRPKTNVPKKYLFYSKNSIIYGKNIPKRIRCGIAFGHVAKINFSASMHDNYDFIGQCINMAARLEGHTKSLGSHQTPICIQHDKLSFDSAFLASNRLQVIKVPLKGFPKPIEAIVTD